MNFSSKLLGMTCASVIALGIGSVNATDLYHSAGGLKDGPYVAPVPLWTGFYAGVNGGGSFGASENLRVTNDSDFTQADIGQFFHDGGFGGGQIGYNFSGFGWGNQVVLGIETDIQGAGINSSFDRNDLNYGFAPALFHAEQNIDYFGTVRGRLGYAFGNALLYATGGFAYANVNTKVNINSPSGNFTNFLSSNDMETGWVAGGGVEYLFAPAWSAKVEYQYIDLGSQTVSAVASDGFIDRMPFDNNFSTVRAGINYHFPVSYPAPLK
jgi:outer membrane immunogenic protein